MEDNERKMLEVIRDANKIIENTLNALIKEEKKFTSVIKGFENEMDFEKISAICGDIGITDASFEFDTNPDSQEIYIFDTDKDRLHKRSMWLVKKVNINNLYYTVK